MWWWWVWASLIVTRQSGNDSSWRALMRNWYSWTQKPLSQVEWKSIRASLFITLLSNPSLSSTTWEHSENANCPNRRDFSFGISTDHDHCSRSTLQLEWGVIEVVARPVQLSHFNHFQRRQISKHEWQIHGERIGTYLQFPYQRTILQQELTIQLNATRPIGEALLSDHHSLQITQPNQLRFFHILEAMRANLNHTQQRPFGEGQLLQSLVVTAVTIHNQLRDGGGQFHQLSLLVDIRIGVGVRHGWMVYQSANAYSSIPLPFSSLFTLRLFRSEKASGDRTALAREGMYTQRAA